MTPNDQKPPVPLDETENRQLDHLLTYTTFHIGVYVSLIAAAIGASTLWSSNAAPPAPTVGPWTLNGPLFGADCALRTAAFFFLLAGFCGGIIGSSIPHRPTLISGNEKIGIWWPRMPWNEWAFWEHRFFWFGVARIVVPYFVFGRLV